MTSTVFQSGTTITHQWLNDVNTTTYTGLPNEIAARTAADALLMPTATLGSSAGSSYVGYTEGGSGAVTRTVQAKLRESVSPEDFGAVGDGVTDDGPAFVLACNYCSLTGATLRMSPKVYKNARVEVHGTYCVEGNGATVMYLGMGQSIIAGTGSNTSAVPSPWPTDSGYSPAYAATTMYTLASPITAGATSFTVTSSTGIVAGQYLFIAGNPTSNSSVGNYIPADFEFVKVVSVVGNVITVQGPILSSYLTTQSGVFYTPGLAVNCKVSNLTINTTTDAYQYVVRSSVNCTIENIIFAGTSAVGGGNTFSKGLVLRNHLILGAYSGYDTGRGAESVSFENITGQVNGTGGTNAFFFEESFYNIRVNNFTVQGNMSGGNITTGVSARKRTIIVSNSVFDTTTYGSYSPLSLATLLGVDVTFINTTFKGAVTTPNAGLYPSITGQALVWQSGSLSADTASFVNCKFVSTNAGNTWPSATGAFNGTVMFDAMNTYTTCTAPSQIYPQNITGTWTPTISGLTTAGTQTYTTQIGNYNRTSNLVTIQFVVVWSASSGTGNIVLAGLPYNTNAASNGTFTVWDQTLTIAAASAGLFSAGNPRIIINKSAGGAGSISGTVSYFI